eukprot:TRINITY_DN3799_c0_g1_i1.p1 TRINITY_DN3799_c0_g1~~TRINITY_DN3799_c0_g1_i1.p1  ORF type:complete len:617 (+),score=173.62 TRINITY_DN3799_c0_g1_i1:155-2005(+)
MRRTVCGLSLSWAKRPRAIRPKEDSYEKLLAGNTITEPTYNIRIRNARKHGSNLPPIRTVVKSPLAPTAARIFNDLDEAGYMWTDKTVSQMLTHMIHEAEAFRSLPHKYIENDAAPLLKVISRFGPAVVNGAQTKYALLTCYAITWNSHEVDKKLDALREEGPLTDAAYSALLRGYRIGKNVEKFEETVAEVHRSGVKLTQSILEEMSSMYAQEMMVPELTSLLERHGSHVLSEHGLKIGIVSAVDNHCGEVALRLLLEAYDRGFDDTSDKEYKGSTWRAFFCIKNEIEADLGYRLLENMFTAKLDKRSRVYLTQGSVNRFNKKYVAPYDGYITACHEAGLPEHAWKAFQFMKKHDAHHLALDTCHTMLAMYSVLGVSDPERLAEVVVHMQEHDISPNYSTLQHLQVAIESTWDPLVLQASLLYCQNIEDKLIHYIPGFRDFKNKRPAIGGQAGMKAFLKKFSHIVVPHESYMLRHAQALIEEAAGYHTAKQVVVPYSTLSAMQMFGDEMREQQVEGYEDHGLKAVGTYAVSNPGVVVLGIAEQRICSDAATALAAALDPLSEVSKLAALVASFSKHTTDLTIEVRTSSTSDNVAIINALTALGVQEGRVRVVDVQ